MHHLTSPKPHQRQETTQNTSKTPYLYNHETNEQDKAEQYKYRKASQTSPEAICNHTIWNRTLPLTAPKPGLIITLDRTPLVENRREDSPSRLQMALGWQTWTTTLADKQKSNPHGSHPARITTVNRNFLMIHISLFLTCLYHIALSSRARCADNMFLTEIPIF
jgi:hypothetical protein